MRICKTCNRNLQYLETSTWPGFTWMFLFANMEWYSDTHRQDIWMETSTTWFYHSSRSKSFQVWHRREDMVTVLFELLAPCCTRSFCDVSAAVFSQLAARWTSSKEFRTQPILKAPEASDIEHFIWRSCINYPSPKVQISSFFFTTGRCSGASTRRWCRSGQDQGFFPNVKVVVVGPCEFIRWGWITP